MTTVSAASGDTIYVSSSGNDSWDGQSATQISGTTTGPKLSIKNATGTINTNGTIRIAKGQYTGENNTNITIDKNMNIIGESQTGTIINGTGTNWIFQINPDVNFTVQNLTITNATTSAIYNKGILTVSNCTFTDNNAAGGGAIHNSGTCNVTDSTFTGNIGGDGGAINNQYRLTVSNCTFTDNTGYHGGTIINFNICNVTDSTFTDNTASVGGAIYNYAGNNGISLTANYNRFYNNTATYGNAIYCGYGSVDANYNWWGSNTDPKIISNLIYVTTDGSVNTTLWVILSVNAKPTTINNTQNTNVTADLNHTNDGNLLTSGQIPDGIPVTFSNTLGSVNLENAVTGSGQATTTFTPNCYSGTATVYATVDGFSLGTTITVTNSDIYVSNNTGSDTTGDGSQSKPYKTINKGISMVASGGTVHIADGTYTGMGNTNLTISKNMNIIGQSQKGTIINGTDTNWIFDVYADVTITNLTLTNGKAGLTDMYGNPIRGAICNEGTLSVNGCTFTNNTACLGGAICNTGTIISLSGCTFTNNNATYHGGAICNENHGTIDTLSGCTFTNNNAGNGGAIDNYGTITTLSGCTFTNTAAYGNGGAIFNCGTITTLSGCNFINNKADLGGAIYNFYGNITSLSGCIFTGNTASLGGAIANIGVITGLSGCTFTNNTAESVYYGQIIGAGGAIYNEGSLTANYNRFYNNTSPSGNAIYCDYGSVDANYNWWSSNLNPKNIDNLIYVNYMGSVDATYWVILTVTAAPNSIKNTQTSVITADLNHYTDSMGNIGTLTDHIPDVPVTFAVDANGTLDSLSGIISNGLDVATTFTATRKGLTTVNATVDEFTRSTTITITNNPPTVPNYDVTTQEDTSTSGTVAGNDADTEDVLSYSVTKNPSHGTITSFNPNTGAWTYMPSKDYNGDDSFEVTINDGDGGTAISTIFIAINSVNDAPIANNDTANTKEDKSTNINVLDNDSDADGDSLTVTNVTQPNHGTATINADGTVTYIPNSNWYGLDSFTYAVSDGNGGIATATVNITVNQAVSDLYIKTTTSNLNPTTGETFTLTYKLGNYGPDEATNVTITFQLPEGLDFVNIKVDKGKCTYNETTRTVTWTLDSVPVGDPYLYLTVKAAGDGTYKITPSTTSATYNLNSGNSGIITINVQPNNSNSNSGNTVNAASKTTIGLQKTGLPLNYLILAVLMVLSGLVPKRK